MAQIATNNREEALDIVQDAMFKLVQKYSKRDASEWGPLFQTILQSRINDWYRRNKVRNRLRGWLGINYDDQDSDPLESVIDEHERTPEQQVQYARSMDILEKTFKNLPIRQQQAFMLRVFEEYDVQDVARIMKCSEGSVKTHFSRAIHKIREKLVDHWP